MASFMFDAVQRLGARSIGPGLRRLGMSIYKSGVTLGGSDIAFERALPVAQSVRVGEHKPTITFNHLIGQGTTIAGDVTVAETSTINFHNLIQAAPGSSVRVGERAVIKDLVVIKADGGKSVTIGDGALVGSNAYLRNCSVGANAVVGIGAKAYDGCAVDGFLGAGAVLLEGARVPEGEIWAGNPAAFVRNVTEEERDHYADLVYQYAKVGEIVAESVLTPVEEELVLETIRSDRASFKEDEQAYRDLEQSRQDGLPFAEEDFANAKRLMDIEEVNDARDATRRKRMSEDYTQNYEDFPRNFNNHKPNYRVHNELKGRADTDAEAQRPDFRALEPGNEEAKPASWTRKY